MSVGINSPPSCTLWRKRSPKSRDLWAVNHEAVVCQNVEEERCASKKTSLKTYLRKIRTGFQTNDLVKVEKLSDQMKREGAQPDLAIYSEMLKGFFKAGKTEVGLELLEEMKTSGVHPNKITLLAVIKACITDAELDRALEIFSEMQHKFGLDLSPSFYRAFLKKCARLRKFKKVEEILNAIKEAGIELDQRILSGPIFDLAAERDLDGAIELFHQVKKQFGLKIFDTSAYKLLLRAYTQLGKFDAYMTLFSEVVEAGVQPDTNVFNSIIKASTSRGDFDSVMARFSEMKEHFKLKPDTQSYNLIFEMCATVGNIQKAEEILNEMREAGVKPDRKTFNMLMKACANSGDFNSALRHFSEMQEHYKLKPFSFVYNCLLYMCANAGNLQKAEELLGQMVTDGVRPNAYTFSIVIEAYAANGDFERGLKLCSQTKHGLDVLMYRSLLEAFAKPKRFQRSLGMFEGGKRTDKAARTMASVIEAFAEIIPLKDSQKCFEACRAMMEDTDAEMPIEPTRENFNALLKLCLRGALVREAQWIFKQMKKQSISPDRDAHNALLAMYAKAKDLTGPKKIRKKIKEKLQPNVDTYNASTEVIAKAVEYEKRRTCFANALALVRRMDAEEIEPNALTYNTLLKLCSKARMVKEAIKTLEVMKTRCISPDLETFSLLLTTCGNASDVESDEEIWDKAKSSEVKINVHLYSKMIKVYAQELNSANCRRRLTSSLDLLEEMKVRGIKPDMHTYMPDQSLQQKRNDERGTGASG